MKIPFFKKIPSLRRQGSREVAQGGAPRAPGLAGGGPGRLVGIPDPQSIGGAGVPERPQAKGPEGEFANVYEKQGSDRANSQGGAGLADRLLKKIRPR